MRIDESKLKKCRKSSKSGYKENYTACCPLPHHNDSNESFVIGINDRGYVNAYCSVCGSIDYNTLTDLGIVINDRHILQPSNNYPTEPTPSAQIPISKPKTRPKPSNNNPYSHLSELPPEPKPNGYTTYHAIKNEHRTTIALEGKTVQKIKVWLSSAPERGESIFP